MILLFPLIGLVIGILCASFTDSFWWGGAVIAVSLLFYFLLLVFSNSPLKSLKYYKLHFIWVVTLFIGLGIIVELAHRPESPDPKSIESFSYAAGEVEEITTYSTGDNLIVKIDYLKEKSDLKHHFKNFKLLIKTDGVLLSKGDLITFPVRLREITDNPNYPASGYAERMRKKGIFYRCDVSSDKIKNIGHHNSIINLSSHIKDLIIIRLEKSRLSRDTSDFLISLLTGDRSFLSSEVKESFSQAGLAHVLALSGLHISIMVSFLLFLFYPLRLIRLRKAVYILTIIFIWAFAFVTGMAPSTLRAALMSTFVLVGLMLQKKNVSANALLAAALLILIFTPSMVFDPGLQLSFISVAAILTFIEPLNPVNPQYHKRLHAAVSLVLTSLIATACSWVLVSYYFQRIPLLFIPYNFLLLPLLPFFMSAAIVYTLLLFIGFDISQLAFLLDKAYEGFIAVMDFGKSFGDASIDYKATFPVIILWVLALLCIGYAVNKKKYKSAGLILSSLVLASFIVVPLSAEKTSQGIIFQKNYNQISMAVYDGKNCLSRLMPRNTFSSFLYKNCEIYSLDCKPDDTELLQKFSHSSSKNKKYLILGSKFSSDILENRDFLNNFEKIIIHPSINRKKEKEMLRRAFLNGMNHFHSLRNDGPLEIPF